MSSNQLLLGYRWEKTHEHHMFLFENEQLITWNNSYMLVPFQIPNWELTIKPNSHLFFFDNEDTRGSTLESIQSSCMFVQSQSITWRIDDNL